MDILKFMYGLFAAVLSGILNARAIKEIVGSDKTEAEKKTAVAEKLERFRERCASLAAATETEWDDKIFAGLADLMDDAAALIVSKWG